MGNKQSEPAVPPDLVPSDPPKKVTKPELPQEPPKVLDLPKTLPALPCLINAWGVPDQRVDRLATAGMAAYIESLGIHGQKKKAGEWAEVMAGAHSLTAYFANLEAKFANWKFVALKDTCALAKQVQSISSRGTDRPRACGPS